MMERTMCRLMLLSLVVTALSAEEFIHQRSVAQLLPPNKDKCTDCKRWAKEYCNRNEMSDTECKDYGDQQCRDDCKAECSKCKERIIYMCQKEELGEEECEDIYSEECREKCYSEKHRGATRSLPSCRRRCLQAQMRKCKTWKKGCISKARIRCSRKCTGRLMKRK